MCDDNILVNFIKMNKEACVPVYERSGDCACSLRVIEDYTINPGKRILAHTGLAIKMPFGYEAQVRPRSGLAWKKGLTVLNSPGTVDSAYTGEIMIILINFGDEPIIINKGDSVAQLKFSKVYTGVFNEVDVLEKTERGNGGLGSTGK
jgi:dUTP pyrophosphatase